MRKVKIGVAWIGRSVLLAMAKARFTKITNRPDIYKYIHFVGHINIGYWPPSYTARAVADASTSYYFIGYLYAKGDCPPHIVG